MSSPCSAAGETGSPSVLTPPIPRAVRAMLLAGAFAGAAFVPLATCAAQNPDADVPQDGYAEMDSEPVAIATDPGSIGEASFETTGIAHEAFALAPPTTEELASLAVSRRVRNKNGLPFQIGYARDVARSAVDLSALPWEKLPMVRSVPDSR